MKNRLRRVVYLLFGACLIGAVAFGFRPQPVNVDMAEVHRGDIEITVDEDGKTRIREKYIVSAPLGGRLLRIDLEPGDMATANQTLVATVEPSDPQLLDARALAEAKARAQAAEAALKRADPVLQQARVALEYSETELARVRGMRSSNASSQKELDDAKLAFRSKAEEFRSAKFAQEIAAYEFDQTRAALLRTRPRDTTSDEANDADDYQFEISSPISGKVLRVFQESSAVVTPGTPLLELGDTSDLEIEIDVLSSDAVRIVPGHDVKIDHWGGPNTLLGRVRLVEPAAFTKISALGVEEQRVWVIANFVTPPEERKTLGDGFRIEARVVTSKLSDVLRVRVNALFRAKQQADPYWTVFKVNDGVARATVIEIGKKNDIHAEVLNGLTEGDRVISHPGEDVRDGVLVAANPE